MSYILIAMGEFAFPYKAKSGFATKEEAIAAGTAEAADRGTPVIRTAENGPEEIGEVTQLFTGDESPWSFLVVPDQK